MVITGEHGEIERLSGLHDQPYERARKAYRHLTGMGFKWEDDLPHDQVADMEYLAQA